MNNKGLVFDDALHEYSYDGRVIPSVTQVLQDSGIVDTTHFKPEHAQRGTYVHTMLEMWDKDELDAPEVPGEYTGYLTAWQRFVNQLNPSFDHIEEPIMHSSGMYAGTVDRIGTLNGKKVVIDIKTSKTYQSWWGIQLAAYRDCLDDPAGVMCITIQVGTDGKYRIQYHSEVNQLKIFFAALSIRNWKFNEGLI